MPYGLLLSMFFFQIYPIQNLADKHTISPNGYDAGRYDLSTQGLQHYNIPFCSDSLVATATKGETSFDGVKYSATAKNVTGLLSAGSNKINHGKNSSYSSGTLLMVLQVFQLTAT